MKRNCAYTDKIALTKDSVLPRSILGDESYNWDALAPINKEFKAQKEGRMPTELEMQANELFHLLELARLRVKYFEEKLKEVQGEILKDFKEPVKTGPSIAQAKAEKKIEAEKIIVKSQDSAKEFLEKRRKNFMDEE